MLEQWGPLGRQTSVTSWGGILVKLVPHLPWPDAFGWMYFFPLCLLLGRASRCHNRPDEAVKTNGSHGHGMDKRELRAWAQHSLGSPLPMFAPSKLLISFQKNLPFLPVSGRAFGISVPPSCFSFSGAVKRAVPSLVKEPWSWDGGPGMSQ